MMWPHAALSLAQIELIDHAVLTLKDQYEADDRAAANECQIIVNELQILMNGLAHALKNSNATVINVGLCVTLHTDGR